MWELQYNFIMQNISHYYSEINIPLISCKNKFEQANDLLPDNFIVYEEDEIPEELKQYAGTILTQVSKTEKELSTT